MANWKEADTSYALAYRDIDFRKHPELYRVGKGEQGVLMTEPYKSEILPYWKFKDTEAATESADKILELFYDYLKSDDFVGADMARKFLMMGFTRARRYSNHRSGRKYDADMNVLPQEPDHLTCEKAESARIFYGRYLEARENPKYKRLMAEHKAKYGKWFVLE